VSNDDIFFNEHELGYGVEKDMEGYYGFQLDLEGYRDPAIIQDYGGHHYLDDHGNNYRDATPVDFGDSQVIKLKPKINMGGDIDVFKLALKEAMNVSISISDSWCNIGATATLKDSDGKTLGTSEGFIGPILLDSGEYFIEVNASYDFVAGTYNLKIIRNEIDKDSISNKEEMGPSGSEAEYDGNNDGLADYLQNNVSSFFASDGENYVTLATPEGVALQNINATQLPSDIPEVPDGAELVFGCFDYTIQGIESGGATTVTLYLPDGVSVDAYYNYGPTPSNPENHWYSFMYDGQTGAEIKGDKVILHFIDGKRGDSDLLSNNGSIEDPGGPVRINKPAEIDGNDGGTGSVESGGSGGRCFISTLSD